MKKKEGREKEKKNHRMGGGGGGGRRKKGEKSVLSPWLKHVHGIIIAPPLDPCRTAHPCINSLYH